MANTGTAFTAQSRIQAAAAALEALRAAGLLNDPQLKDPICRIIRVANEGPYPHATTHYRSVDAAKIMKTQMKGVKCSDASYHRHATKAKLRHEHMVPVGEIYRFITGSVATPKVRRGQNFIQKVLTRFGQRATVTAKQDKKLRARGLNAVMPSEFYDHSHALYGDPMARYKKAKLFGALVPRRGKNWCP